MLDLSSGPMRIEEWYEDHEKCECDPPFEQIPTSDYKTHQKTCPLYTLLEEKYFKKYSRIYGP